jgi:hypothetical protein
MRAVYSSSARNVWVDKERLIVLIVGCMADMIAVRGDLKIFGSREGGGAVGNNVVIKSVSAYYVSQSRGFVLTSAMIGIASQRSISAATFSFPLPPSQIPPSSTSSTLINIPRRLLTIHSPLELAKEDIVSSRIGCMMDWV